MEVLVAINIVKVANNDVVQNDSVYFQMLEIRAEMIMKSGKYLLKQLLPCSNLFFFGSQWHGSRLGYYSECLYLSV